MLEPLLSRDSFLVILSVIFVAANAFFVAAEFAIVKIRATRLEVLAIRGDPIARLAKKIVTKLDAYLSATQLGITLASLGLGWIGEPAFARIIGKFLSLFDFEIADQTLHSVSFTGAFLLITGLHIVLGELVPKSIAIRTAERICLLVALPLHIFYLIFFPFLWALNGLSNIILRVMGVAPAGWPGRAHTEEELKLVFEDSLEEGSLGPWKKTLLDKAIDFSHKTVRDIAIPVEKMIFFDPKSSLRENLLKAKEASHTRFPVREGADGRVLGFIHMKDVIWGLENAEVINLYDLIRPAIFFPVNTKLDVALKEFQKKKIHLGIVGRSEDAVEGLVTLEDVIEELVGEIQDEFDRFPSSAY